MGKIKLYFNYFKNKLFSKKESKKTIIDTEEIKQEIWIADFSDSKKARFNEKSSDGEKVFFEKRDNQTSLVLELKRKSVYSWAINPIFRYHNFVLEAEIEFDTSVNNEKSEKTDTAISEKAGSAAAGFLFRHIGEKAFYSLLISNKGWTRLDAIVNNNPMPILGWTKPLTDVESNKFKIKLICVSTSITVLINNSWLGKFDSDIVQSAGKIAFAGQNWETNPNAKFYLNSLKIISKPMLVEEAYSVANDNDGIMPEAYINLANTYYAMGQFVAAIYQLKQIWKLREPIVQDLILAGKIYMAQNLIEEAEESFLSALENEPNNIEVQIELASLYYKINKLKELKKILKNISTQEIKSSVLLSTLHAHLLSSENEHQKAAILYHQAFDLSPNSGILKYNEAKELSFAGKKDEAIQEYIIAGNLFLKQKEYNELSNVINALEHLTDNEELWGLRGKFYYAIDNKKEALIDFEKLIKANTRDASIWYLYGLLNQEENSSIAIKSFKKAYKLEPNYGLYSFRLAEALYNNDENCISVLEKSIEVDPTNGWAHNLKALWAMDEDNLEMAEKEIIKARKILPDEIIVLENYIEVKRLRGKLKECETLFDIENGTADLAVEKNRAEGFHVFANALFFDQEYDEADLWFQKAVKLKPFSVDILTDKAENSIEIGFLNDADDLLVKALDIKPSERIYRLISLVAIKKGDYNRAEIVYQQAVENFGLTENLLFDLANFYIQSNKKEKAKIILKKLQNISDQDLLEKLKNRFKLLK